MKDDVMSHKVEQKRHWRGMDELEASEEYNTFLEREFPVGAAEFADGVSRRTFIKLMGASMALAGMAGCRRPTEKIVPYVSRPEEVVPGVANTYATTVPYGLDAVGALVTSYEGRPTKLEGNPSHPASGGRSNSILQAETLGLYDPDRSKALLHNGATKGWSDFLTFWREEYRRLAIVQGKGLAVIAESFHSPTLKSVKRDFLRQFPLAKWVTFEPISDENIHEGTYVATGERLQPIYQYDRAKVILSLDADFLHRESGSLRNAYDFTKGRRVKGPDDSMNRLYVVEGVFSLTGGNADHRMALQSSEIGAFLAALALELRSQGLILPGRLTSSLRGYKKNDFDAKWLRAVAKDLLRNRRRGLIVVGRRQPTSVHALAFALNQALANVGQTVSYVRTTDAEVPQAKLFNNLVERMRAGGVETLVMLGGNPVYNAPADLDFAGALARVKNSIHLSLYADETSGKSTWHIPKAHVLESWDDARSLDGTLSVSQPLIAPLFGGKPLVEFAYLLATGKERGGFEIVRDTWRRGAFVGSSDKAWRRLLHDGVLAKNGYAKLRPRVNLDRLVSELKQQPFSLKKATKDSLEVVFHASEIGDGRYANNGWLQELPDPVTKLTWDNAAVMSPKTAASFGLKNKMLVELKLGGKSLTMPVWVLPGQTDFVVSLALGYGRKRLGRVGNGVGFNSYSLRTKEALYFSGGLQLTKTGKTYELSTTQLHGSMEGRPIVNEATLEEFRINPKFAKQKVKHPPLKSLWQEKSYDKGYQWGMAIDLNACTGCGACTVACQSENNIPIVGKKQVGLGREMNWLRVDRYFSGEMESPSMVHQPVPCQHCENAPCEQVCPVAATVHDDEGLNVMTYNRCIGTRYCANNCPYKVRKFNFLNFTNKITEVEKMAQNPDVTVRFRGVMEKCTFCTQRINGAKEKAKQAGREVQDGDFQTACQQSCPVDAIAFGNINDPKSKVSELKKQSRNYELLAEINVKPRNSYLAKLRNPNPELIG